MADGEVEVAVRAEGVEEAAAEMGGDGDGEAAAGGGQGDGGLSTAIRDDEGGEGGGQGDGGLSTAIKGGIVGGLISSALEPLLEVLDPILKIFQAFVAPLAVLLLRILTPVLRFFLRYLPVYLDKFEEFETLIASVITGLSPLVAFLPSIVNFVSKLPGKIDTLKTELKEKLRNLPGKIRSKLETIKNNIVTALENLPSNIKSALVGERAADINEQGVGDGPGGDPATAEQTAEQTGLPEPLARIINISGGLAPFISQITSNQNIDFSQ